MGDRVSIQFKKGEDISPVLFSHWRGMEFIEEARNYVKELIAEVGNSSMYPLDRLEPRTVLVDFVRYITQGEIRVKSDLYLGVNEDDGDNSDNGHFVIELNKEMI